MQEMLPAQKGLTVILTPFSYKFWPCLDALFGCFVRHPRGERVKKKRIAVAAAAAAPCGLLQLLGGGLQMLGGLLRLLGDLLLLLHSLRGQPHPSMRMPPRPASFRSPPLASSL